MNQLEIDRINQDKILNYEKKISILESKPLQEQIQTRCNFDEEAQMKLEKNILDKATQLIDKKLKEFNPFPLPSETPTLKDNEESKAGNLENPQIISNYDQSKLIGGSLPSPDERNPFDLVKKP